ncbi:TetR/AcrR family transcriptional regulator [Spirosoma sp. BT702]|uniref:TetR/AcrR family transcriptional regulator n=1 Tax=Spirosoma profusum TaxID=2771354 RepID=A0A926XWJ2_9BACT|nr:TetR/AcrR family transcriptional regulator [Spirosoma profusum]MBD2699092.1 TetR/AcrR family transcriptional regulator [Spirosoma profusum]
MGIVERKEREREEMRKLILEGAQKLFLTNGFDKVSIRNIADEIEYSPATIYLYFKDKNELFFSLHQKAFLKLIDEFTPIATIQDPMETLIEMGRIYLRFAFENPELYDLMFIMTAPIDTLACRDDVWEDGHRAFGLLQLVVQRCIDAGAIKHPNAEQAGLMIWSTVHGLVALHLRKRMSMFEEDAQKLLDNVFELFIATIKRGL